MIKSVFMGLFVIVAGIAVSGVNANAQSQSCTTWVYCSASSLWYGGCAPTLPAGAFNCQSTGSWGLACSMMLPICVPVAAGPETRSPKTCPECTAGSPISLITGNTYIDQADIRIPGLSNGLSLVRTWNSQWPSTQILAQVGLFGPNWRSTYEERVFVGGDNYVKYARSDGSFWSFGWTSGLSYSPAAPQNVTATLVEVVDSTGTPINWTLTFQNGEQRIFNFSSGLLTAIIDRNGNATQLSYDATSRLVTVTDPGGRHLYFGYASSSSYLVTSVTSDVGISLSYSYDTQGRLVQITKPDLTTLSFTYDANSLITAVKDSAGKILESHTYDSNGRGLTSSRAGGVESLTVTYPTP